MEVVFSSCGVVDAMIIVASHCIDLNYSLASS